MNQQPNELLERFFKFQNLLIRHHHAHGGGRGPMGDVMRGQGRVLSLLKMKPEITQKELAWLLDMRPQSLSELLSKLENKALITRTPSDGDRRVMMIRLTEKGAAEVERTDADHPERGNPFACLSDEEQRQLTGMLDRLIAGLEQTMEGEEHGFGKMRDPWERRDARGHGFGGGNPPPPPPHPDHRGPFDRRPDRDWGGRDNWQAEFGGPPEDEK